MASERPGIMEATAAAIAGAAFGLSLLFVKRAVGIAPGLFDAGAAILLGLGLGAWAHRLGGPFTGTLARGAGAVVGILLASREVVAPFFAAVAPAALIAAGATLLQANARRERPSGALEGGGFAILAGGVALGLLVASGFPEPGRLRSTLLAALVGVAGGLALRRALLARGHASWAPQPLGILLVASLAAAYVSYRSLARAHVDNLVLYEWTAAAAAGALALARLRRRARDGAVADSWSGVARRHAQDARPAYDERMAPLAAVVSRYLEHGAGFDEYKAAMSRHAPERSGAWATAIAAAERATRPSGRGRAAKREAARTRLIAHEALMHIITPRGRTHGAPEPDLRPDP